MGLGRDGGLTRFTRGGNFGEGALGANLAFGARGTLGAREKEEKLGGELILDTLGTTGTLGASRKPNSCIDVLKKNRLYSKS